MAIADLYDHFLFDLDGCLYLLDQVIPAAPRTLAELRRRGKGILFLTNDPRSPRAGYAEKLRRMGIQAEVDEILSCGWATAIYIKDHHAPLEGKGIFVVGSAGLKDEMRSAGLTVLEGLDARHADFVAVGGHNDFDYEEMMLANFALQNGAIFYTTNRDATFPTPAGVVPATGAVLAGIEVASGRSALSIGKPEPGMIEAARSLLGSGRMIMVGDRLDSDIEGGKRAGIATALVLTGVTSREQATRSEWTPDYILQDVGGLQDEDPNVGG